MTQDMKKDMILKNIAKRLVRNGRTPVRIGAYSSSLKGVLRAILLLLTLSLGAGTAWGQSYTVESGFYYLENKQNNDHYFLVPAGGTGSVKYFNNNKETPYLTSYKKSKETEVDNINNFIWYIEKVTDGDNTYYRFRHLLTGKYVVANGVVETANPARLRLHLETQKEPDENTLFVIEESTSSDKTLIGIHHKSVYATHTDGKEYWWWDVADGNKDNYSQGDSKGLLAFWNIKTDNTGRTKWAKPTVIETEKKVCLPPVISYDSSTGKVTISSYEGFNDVTYYYTTDGTDPTTSSTEYNGTPFDMPSGETVVKAIAKRGDFKNATVTTYNVGQCATPVITMESDGTYTVNCATADVTFYYTTDGTMPTTTSTSNTTGSISLPLDLDGEFLRVIAAKTGGDGSDASPAALYYIPQCAKPTIKNTNGTITMTTATTGATIYYTKDKSDPTTTNTKASLYSESYSYPITQGEHTITARAVKAGYGRSVQASLVYAKCATPVLTNLYDGNVTITCDTGGASIYYTTNGNNPQSNGSGGSLLYSENPITLPEGTTISTIKARAFKLGNGQSDILTYTVLISPVPSISLDDNMLTITCDVNDANIYYSFSESGSDWTLYETPLDVSSHELVRSYTGHAGYRNSEVVTYHKPPEIHSVSAITSMNGSYLLASDFTWDAPIGTESAPFTGTLDGHFHTLSGSGPLVAFAEGATIKNVILDNVSISSAVTFGDDNKKAIGAIACVAKGTTRIYNCGILATGSTVKTNKDGYTEITSCSSSVGGTADYVGGLVGFLDGEARVINCYSYANITDGTEVGGIVGHNNVATASNNLKTMVMNCMFYGDITGGTSIAPIYNGTEIVNKDANGVGNYNYFRLEAPYVKPTDVVYNGALGAENRFLQRFEFYRHLLNSHRNLAAWWATNNYDNKGEMAKWVLEPSQLGGNTPYPILKTPKDQNGKVIQYPSVVNIDAKNATTQTERNKGGKLGELSVTIQMGSGGAVYGPPTGAEIIESESSLTLNITDKDPDHFNFNYYKVQLPYYNDVGTKNYNGNRVVTGWKIVDITDGTAGTYSTGEDVTYTNGVLTATPYNFADRNCTNKDLYSVSGRVFNQGAYWDVPYGVTAITIEPYWAKCTYLADAYADVVYNTAMTSATNVPNVGGGRKYTDGFSYSIAGESQKVFTSKDNATSSSNSGLYQGVTGTPKNQTVYDYAVVLVGNYHNYNNIEASMDKPYTVTSIDLDGDNEPDYSYILRFDSRKKVHPVRVDFINIPGLGMAQKSTGGTGTYNFGIMQPKGWFESTNTSLFRETQFEYDSSERIAAPYILQGGVMEQWVNGQSAGHANLTTYFHVGGNVWFKEFHRGTHQDQNYDANHSPVSVTGGDFDQFHLTGLYRADATIRDDNAECYITGGRFGVVAGTGMDGIGHPTNHTKGNITWIIDNADIKEFYAGSFNADKPAQGNLHTIVNGGYIDLFCGGPKFGDMNSGRTVTTTATDCTFGTFFGAGYGGNSYSRQAPRNHNNIVNFPHNDSSAGNDASWNAWLNRFYKQEYNSTYGGVSTQFSYQFLPMSGNADNCARIFVEYVKFSLATTHNVTSTLTGCTINNNFYGGGSLGKVAGNVTSILDGCTVKGNVFGAGFSASLPPVEVDAIGFEVEPLYYEALGTYRTGVKYVVDDPEFVHELITGTTTHKYAPTTYTWEHTNTVNSTASAIDKTNHILYTQENLEKSNLGSVAGNVSLTIKGNSKIGTDGDTTGTKGNVFGGGESSYVTGATNKVTVNLQGNTEVLGNVFGGGDNGEVQGSTEVNIMQPTTTP